MQIDFLYPMSMAIITNDHVSNLVSTVPNRAPEATIRFGR